MSRGGLSKLWLAVAAVIMLVVSEKIGANPVDTNRLDTNSDDKGIKEIVNDIIGLGDRSQCSTALGHPGKCSYGYCSNLVNQTRSSCPGSTNSFYKCCPTKVLPELFPPTVEGCGIRPIKPTNLIIGGTEAVPHSWPWAIALYRVSGHRKYFLCGGSIIGQRFILTAAHCVHSQSESFVPEDFVVKIGAHKLNTGRFVEIERIMVHENYSPRYHNDDIALLKLKIPLDFDQEGSNIKAVCLPKSELLKENRDLHRVEGKLATMVGWGVSNLNTATPSNKLMEVQVPVFNQKTCQKNYEALIGRNSYFNWDNVICAGVDKGGKDTCQGDSGGSMTVASNTNGLGTLRDDPIYEQVGVVSFGYGCAQKGYPGVYTFIPHYLNWLGYHMTL